MRVCIPGRRVFSSVVAVACLAVTAHGQTWTGSGGDGLWLTPNNWTPIAIPANDGTADLQFGTGSGRSTTVGVPWSVHSISFINSTGLTFSGFTITGQPITLGAGGLTNNRTNSGTQTISSAVVLDAAQAWTNNFGSFSTSSVVISGDVDLNAHHLTFAGSASTQVQGDISGDGGLTITGRTNLSGDNTYTGQTIVDGGTLTIGHANALGDVTGGLANGTILRNGGLLALTGGLTYAGEYIRVENGRIAGAYPGARLDGDIELLSDTQFSSEVDLGGSVSGPGELRITSGRMKLYGSTSTDVRVDTNGQLEIQPSGTAVNASNIHVEKYRTLVVYEPAGTDIAANSVAPNSVLLVDESTLRLGADVSPNAFIKSGSTNVNLALGAVTDYTAGGTNVIDFNAIYADEPVRFSAVGTSSIASGVVVRPHTSNDTIMLGGNSSDLYFNNVLSDIDGAPTHVEVVDSGRIHFAAANDYTGITTIRDGRVYVDHASGLGSTARETAMYGGELYLNAPTSETISVEGGTVHANVPDGGNLSVSGTGVMQFSQAVSPYTGPLSLGDGGTLRANLDDGEVAHISSAIALTGGDGLIQSRSFDDYDEVEVHIDGGTTGTGALRLDAGEFNGIIQVNGPLTHSGDLVVASVSPYSSSDPLGRVEITTPQTLNGQLIAVSGTLSVDAVTTVDKILMQGGTLTGTEAITSVDAELDLHAGSVDMPGGISGITSVRKRSVRIGHLADIGLGMDPLIHVEQGKLFVDGPGLGGATNGITVMQPRHAAVVVNNSMVDDDINLANATGLAFTGGLSARYGGTVTGDVDLGPIGAFVGGRNVNDSDATSFRIDGPIHGGTLTVVGNGGLAVRGAGNTYSGETIIGTNGDTTVLALEENGRLSTTSRIVINPAATLRIGNQMYVSAGDHVADTIPVELNGGKVQLVSGGPDELIGLTTLHRGASILAVSTTQGNVPARTLTIESLARLAGAVLQVDVSYYDDGTPGSHRVKLSTPPTLTAGIVGAWTIAEPGHDGDFASYDPTLGFTRLPEFGRPDDLNTASTTDNVRIDTAQTLTANRHINSLTVHTQDRILLDGHKLTVESGGIILWGGGPLEEIGAGTLTAGATSGGELFFHLHRSANIEADVVDNGAMPVSLVVSSMDGETGILHLSGVNTYSGSTTINGEMSIDEAHSIPTGTDLTINGGLFRTSRGEETVVLGDVTLRDGGWIAPGSLDVRSDYFAVDAESFLIESGHIRSNLTGSGPMTKTTRGTLEIAGLNDGYTGTIDVYDGILHVAGQTALGQGLTTVHPDAILIFEGEDIDGNVLLAGGTIGATEDDASFSGTMSMSGAATVLTFDGLDPEFNNSMRDVEYHQVTFIGSVSLQSGASLSVLDSGGGEFHLACDVDLGPNGLVEGARFDLEDGKTLSGSGSIVGVVDVDNGTLSPGNSAGSLTISELLLSATSHLEFELGSQSDQIAVTDYLVLDGTIDIEALSGFGPGSYRLLTFPAGGEGFLDNGLLLGEIPFGFSPGNFSIEVGDGFVDLNVIPEPSSLTVLAFASVCALARRRRGG